MCDFEDAAPGNFLQFETPEEVSKIVTALPNLLSTTLYNVLLNASFPTGQRLSAAIALRKLVVMAVPDTLATLSTHSKHAFAATLADVIHRARTTSERNTNVLVYELMDMAAALSRDHCFTEAMLATNAFAEVVEMCCHYRAEKRSLCACLSIVCTMMETAHMRCHSCVAMLHQQGVIRAVASCSSHHDCEVRDLAVAIALLTSDALSTPPPLFDGDCVGAGVHVPAS